MENTLDLGQFWVYSQPVDPKDHGPSECFTTLAIRVHKENDIADAAIAQLNKDWGSIVDYGHEQSAGHLSSPVGAMNRFIYPETLPDRLFLAQLFNELAFIHDDLLDSNVSYDTVVREHKDLISGMASTNHDELTNSRVESIRKLLSKAILQCLEVDPISGAQMVDGIRKFSFAGTECASSDHFASVDEYFAYRRRNAGVYGFWTMMMFSYGSFFNYEDLKNLQDIVDPAERAMAFTNDYYSWNKEKKLDKGRIVNLVHFFMTRENINESAAIQKTKEMILTEEHRFVSAREELYRKNPNLPIKLRRLAEYIGAAIAGNHYWHSMAPRYRVQETELKPQCGIPRQQPRAKYVHSTNGVSSAVQPKSAERMAAQKTPGVSLDSSVLLEPVRYIKSLPAKNVRGQLIDALNVWFKIPPRKLAIVKEVVNDLHNSSLILDDIQDSSPLRRGNTAAHLVFGVGQSINSAVYMFCAACRSLTRFNNPIILSVVFEELENLFIGQSWDLDWKSSGKCPTESEYMAMINMKTGSMFKLLLRLMQNIEPTTVTEPSQDFFQFSSRLGRLFQIRDDYMNLYGDEYSQAKGFCEDLDEGKFSYPIVKCCSSNLTAQRIILGIFRQKGNGKLQAESKRQILSLMDRAGVRKTTEELLQQLANEVEASIDSLEYITGEANPTLRLLVKCLAVTPVLEQGNLK